MTDLAEWIKQPIRNEWVFFKKLHLAVYLRKARRYINGEITNTLDIATIEVDEQHRGKGNFKEFLAQAEEAADNAGLTIFVESILEERLYRFLRDRGYQTVITEGCLYRDPEVVEA